MDSTHFRFFDWETAFGLVQNSGFQVVERVAEGHIPMPVLRKSLGAFASTIDKTVVKSLPGLFGDQFILVSHKSN